MGTIGPRGFGEETSLEAFPTKQIVMMPTFATTCSTDSSGCRKYSVANGRRHRTTSDVSNGRWLS